MHRSLNRKTLYALLSLSVFLCGGVPVYAQVTGDVSQLTSQGVLSCRQGKYAMDVGKMTASGIYVPVADAVVEENTGYLIYKACTLDPLIVKLRQDITTRIATADIKAILTGKNGGPQFVTNAPQDYAQYDKEEMVAELTGPDIAKMCSPIRNSVRAAAFQNYLAHIEDPGRSLQCTTTCRAEDPTCGNLQTLFDYATNPENSAVFAYVELQNQIREHAEARIAAERDSYLWGQGFYSQQQVIGGTRQIITPGWAIAQVFDRALNTGFEQLQNATSINQITSAAFSTLSSQILTNPTSGLVGLNQSLGGQPSYLDRLATGSSADTANALKSQVMQMLNNAMNVENTFLSTERAIAQTVANATSSAATAESNCFNTRVIPAVQAYAASKGGTLKVATSTAFSTAFSELPLISALVTATGVNIRRAQQAIVRIQQLMQQLQAATTAAGIQAVSSQISSLQSSGTIKSPSDLPAELTKGTSVPGTVTTLRDDTIKLWVGTDPDNSSITDLPWDGNTSPGTGWCNADNETTKAKWYELWTK